MIMYPMAQQNDMQEEALDNDDALADTKYAKPG